MVAALAAVLPFSGQVFLAGIPLTTAAGGLTLAGTLVNLGGSLLLSAASNALFAPDAPSAPKPEDIQLNIRQPVGARLKHYGRVRVGGTVVFFRAKSGKFYRVVVHGHGQIEAIEEYYLNKGPVTLDASGFVTEPQYTSNGTKRVQIKTRLGVIPETYYSEVSAIWSDWDATHRLDGMWTSLTIAEQTQPNDYRRVYPNNEPAIEIVARTTRVFDPRAGQTAFSDNAALVMADLIESPDGFNRAGYVDLDFLKQAANDADSQVALAAGGTEARWRISGSYGLSERPGTVLRRMQDVCGADVRLLPNGKVGIEMGGSKTPAVTLTSADVLEIQMGDDGPDHLDRFNTLPFTYVDPALAYQQLEGDPWHDARRAAEDGEEMVGPMVNMDMAPSHRQARHAAKIMLGRKNPAERLTVRFRPRAILALYESVVVLRVPEAQIGGLYRIEGYNLNLSDGSVSYNLSVVDPEDYTWAASEEGQPQVLPTPDVSAGIPAPSNFAAGPQGVQTSGGGFSAGIGAVWDPPASDALTPILEFTTHGGSAWTVWPTGNSVTSAVISPLIDGSAYDLRLSFVAPDGAKGPYATETNKQALASTAAPAQPTGLTVSDQTGGVARVQFTASSSANIWKTEVYRDAVLIGTFFNDPDEAVSFDDISGAGTFDWTARSINVSGVANTADAGPFNKTIT